MDANPRVTREVIQCDCYEMVNTLITYYQMVSSLIENILCGNLLCRKSLNEILIIKILLILFDYLCNFFIVSRHNFFHFVIKQNNLKYNYYLLGSTF